MPADPADELAQFRSRRDRERRDRAASAADDAGQSIEQQQAIARARESWRLSRHSPHQPDDGAQDD